MLALPYLQGYRQADAEERTGVVVHAPEAWDGLNLFVSGHAAEAVLMDMDGRIVHRWRCPLRRLWPELAAQPRMAKLDYFRRAHVFPDGELIAIFEGEGLVKLDARSRVLWSLRGGFHHDLFAAADGTLFVLDRQARKIPRLHPRRAVLEDFVTVLGPDGRVLRRVSILEALERSPWAHLVRGRRRAAGDIFHTNTIEVLDGRLADRIPAFRAGNVLVSVRELHALAVIDLEREAVVWALTGPWRRQHQPVVLDSGRLLLFDNQGAGEAGARVLEVDPASGEVGWRWGGTAETRLDSGTLGSVQRLPNGNTLITESHRGRAIEVTPEGRVVWEFHNPYRAGPKRRLVASLFEVVRLPTEMTIPEPTP